MATTDDYGPNDRGSDDFDRFAREAGDGLRRLLRQALENPRATATWADIAANAARSRPAPDPRRGPRPEPRPEPHREPQIIDADRGVWAVVGAGDRVERIFATELDALRANQVNTDPQRGVRFLEFGSVIGDAEAGDKGDRY